MLRSLTLAGLLLCLPIFPADAADLTVAENLVFVIEPVSGWTVHTAGPPEALVKETARHVAHEPAAVKATAEQIEIVARNRLAANEAIVFHATSGAHLNIDFSPFDERDSVPGPDTLKSSAEHAARSLANEKDVTDAAWDVKETEIAGARKTYLLSAKFLQHARPMIFRGYIGTVERHWFFLYFTAPRDDPRVLQEMSSMLANASIRVVTE